jgi:diguanylate cyclase (GGDEF)-like protein
MKKFFYSWRYYTLGHEQYDGCMKNSYKINLYNLRQGNIFAAVLAFFFAFFPIIKNADFKDAAFYFLASFFALLFALAAGWEIRRVKKQRGQVNKKFTYIFTAAYYINIILFGMYLGIWSNPGNYAVAIMIILVCALSLFIFSPVFNLCLTACAMAAFIVSVIFFKSPQVYIYDICNIIFAGIISLFFCWRISMLRLTAMLTAYKLEDERNKYLDESIIDDLTKLKNRRDFFITFQRYLLNYRASDTWLCAAIADIDFFKNYNDHYGHPKGDDCLRAIGGAFNRLKETMGVYSARVGGEEFAMLWFENDASHADAVVRRFSMLIKALKIPHEKSSVNEYVTMSVGVYIEKCGASHDPQELYNQADKLLYTAKDSGRNCAIISGRDIAQYRLLPDQKQS